MKELLQRSRSWVGQPMSAIVVGERERLLDDLDAAIAQQAEPVAHLDIVEASLAALIDSLLPAFAQVGVSLRVSQEDHAAIRSALAGAQTGLHLLRARTATPQPPAAEPARQKIDYDAGLRRTAEHVTKLWQDAKETITILETRIGEQRKEINRLEDERHALVKRFGNVRAAPMLAPAEPVSAEGLPPMPEAAPHYLGALGFTASNMAAYALQCIAADRAARGAQPNIDAAERLTAEQTAERFGRGSAPQADREALVKEFMRLVDLHRFEFEQRGTRQMIGAARAAIEAHARTMVGL